MWLANMFSLGLAFLPKRLFITGLELFSYYPPIYS